VIIPPPPKVKKKKKRPLSKETKTQLCLTCGKEIIVQNSRKGRKFFCSRKCHHQSMRHGAEIECSICGKKFWLRQSYIDSGIDVCSPECLEDKRAYKAKVDILDKWWSLIIKMRAGYKCEYCGTTGKTNFAKIKTKRGCRSNPLNSHHIYSSGLWPVRWDLDNGICLCVKHHILGALSAHKSSLLFADWIREQRGEVWHKRLLEKVKHGEHPNRAIEYFRLKTWIDIFQDPFNESERFDIKDWDWNIVPTIDAQANWG